MAAVSPLRAAIFQLILTVGLPSLTVPVLAGGAWNEVPGGVGMCWGVLLAVLSTVAAGMPMMFTPLLRPPSMIPAGLAAHACNLVSFRCVANDGLLVLNAPALYLHRRSLRRR